MEGSGHQPALLVVPTLPLIAVCRCAMPAPAGCRPSRPKHAQCMPCVQRPSSGVVHPPLVQSLHFSLCCSWCCGTKTPTCCLQRSRRLKVCLGLLWDKQLAARPSSAPPCMHLMIPQRWIGAFTAHSLSQCHLLVPSPAPRPCCRGICLQRCVLQQCIAYSSVALSATLLCLLLPAADYLSNHPLVDKAISPRCVLAEFTNAGPRLALRVSGSGSSSTGLGRGGLLGAESVEG